MTVREDIEKIQRRLNSWGELRKLDTSESLVRFERMMQHIEAVGTRLLTVLGVVQKELSRLERRVKALEKK